MLDTFLRNFNIYSNDIDLINQQMQQLEQFPVEDVMASLGPEATRAIDHWSNMRQYHKNAQGMKKGLAWQQREAAKLKAALALPELDPDDWRLDDEQYRNILRLRDQLENRIKQLERRTLDRKDQVDDIDKMMDRYPYMFKISAKR